MRIAFQAFSFNGYKIFWTICTMRSLFIAIKWTFIDKFLNQDWWNAKSTALLNNYPNRDFPSKCDVCYHAHKISNYFQYFASSLFILKNKKITFNYKASKVNLFDHSKRANLTAYICNAFNYRIYLNQAHTIAISSIVALLN